MTGFEEWMTGVRGRRAVAVVLGTFVCAAAVALPATAERGGNQTVQVASTGLGAERVKTVPIVKNPGAKTRVAMSLPPGKVGPVGPGDAVWAGAEIEVSTTCLQPMPQCVGRIYHYSPHVRARLVLADSPTSTGENTVQIGKAQNLRCSQELPHRNHHCVVVVDGMRELRSGDNLPCQRCYVNVLLDAFHENAKEGNQLVVGTDQNNGHISQNKGMLNAAVFNPGPPQVNPDVTRRPSTKQIPVAPQHGSAGGDDRVILSQRLNDLRQGEQLVIDVRIEAKTAHIGYGALLQSQLVLSEKPGSTRRNGVPAKVATNGGIINAQNGFNCTRGKSGHKSPCVIHKVAAVRITKDARTKPDRGKGPFVPLFVNLVVGSKAEFGGERWHPSDAAKVADKGALEIMRFGPQYRR